MQFDFNSLTAKQKKVYSVIEAFIKERGIPPTVREIGELTGEKTPGAVQGILNRLEQKGVIKREVGMARSIQLVSDESQYIKPVYVPEIKKISRRNINDLLSVYNISKYHPVSPDFVNFSGECFIIKCSDDGIFDSPVKRGDTLIISRDCTLESGDTILVMYENHALLRYYYRHAHPSCIILKTNDSLIDREVFSIDEVIIIGKLIGKHKKY